jgi:hypothetical protein
VPDVEKIGRMIGWKPVTPLNQTIDQIIEYERVRLDREREKA